MPSDAPNNASEPVCAKPGMANAWVAAIMNNFFIYNLFFVVY